MKLSYRARIALLALLLALSTLFASCDLLVGNYDVTISTQETTTPGTTPNETTANDPSSDEIVPDVTTSELVTPQPEITTSEPTVTTSEPEVTTTEPKVTTTEPEVITTEPEVTTTEPEVTTPEPEVTTTEPEVTTPDPEAGTVKVVIADYAAANGWTNSTNYKSVPLNSYITASVIGTPIGNYPLNTGKYYDNGQNWRIYQKENATLTISGEGKIIVSVKVTYSPYNTGSLTLDGKNIASGTVVTVNASSITFGVGNTGDADNGQARITAIEVVYGNAAELPEETTPEPEVTTTEPEVTTTEPEVTTTEPEVTTTEPEVTTPNPEAGTVKVVIADYAAANGWTNSTNYPSIPLNSYITASVAGNAIGNYSLTTGKYYDKGQNWRIYQTEAATLTIAANGTTIVSVKVTYVSEKTGVLTFNGKNIASNTVVAVNANAITFGITDTNASEDKGQVRITAIEVVYGNAAELPEETTPEPDVTIPEPEETTASPEEISPEEFDYSKVPTYSGSKFVAINGNVPYFKNEDYTTISYERYSVLDALGRCGVAMACVGRDLMPTGARGDISDVKPSGWIQASYDIVDGKYLYNRSHLIGWQLSGEDANNKNLITGTRSFNQLGMLPFENMIADYVKETNNHVLYRVTPVFVGNELVARGVLMEAWSVEDNGDGVCFNVFVYNVEPGIIINYATGSSRLEGGDSQPEESPVCDYVANKGSSKKFHCPDCKWVSEMKESNKEYYTATREEMIAMGYSPCSTCNP